MDEHRQRIIEDLAENIKGEIKCDPLTVSLYSSDASLYQIAPLGVVFPKDSEDVVALAKYSEQANIPLIARGAGSGLAGQCLGEGLIVDFSRHMRNIESIGEETVRVQPGIVRDELNNILKEYGRYFPPDPANSSVTTVGSMLAVDAAGSRSVRVGSTRDHVESIELVVAGGQQFEVGNESLEIFKAPLSTQDLNQRLSQSRAGGSIDSPGAIKRTIVSKLAKILADNAELIADRQPALLRNCCGYYLRGGLSKSHLNLARMMVGSEGTLALFTAATLHTAPLPEHRGIVLLLFQSLMKAVDAVQEIAPLQPSACDLLDRRVLTLGRESDSRFARMISPQAEAALIVEQVGFSSRQAEERIQSIVSRVRQIDSETIVALEAYSYDDVEFVWSLPQKVVPLLTRLAGVSRPQPFVEDIAVPPGTLNDFLLRAQKVFQQHEVTASLYAHAAAGQLHIRPFLPTPGPQDGARIEAIARDLYQVVFSVGGTISGEHGDGLSRTAFIRSQYGPLYKVFQQIKDIFDPHNLMNPGKIVSDDAHITIRNFRPELAVSPDVVNLQLQWTPNEMMDAAALCNGCGTCRTTDHEFRMCPFFRIDPDEEASPRAKANVMRNYACGELPEQEFDSPLMKRLADLCFNCKQCQLECPSNVNIPQLMIEAKAAYVAANGLTPQDWILSRAHSFGALGCTVAPAANWAISNPLARWLMERLLGIHRMRKLPSFARRTFLRSAKRELLNRPASLKKDRLVVYFVDHYANYHDPELGRAFVEVLQHNGISVYVPPGQTVSGMAMVSAGDLNAARRVAELNIRELVELAREGIPIVCTEPSAALCLKHEYPFLSDHPDVEVVSAQTIEAGAYLEQLHDNGVLNTKFAPVQLDVGYHTPCHLKALGTSTPLSTLLNLIPELTVHRIDKGCTGMAGTFGLTRENFSTSVQIGWDLISSMREGTVNIGTTECSSCKMQMEQGTTTPTIHPIKLIALAYGLMPEIRQRLNPSTKKLLVT